MKMKAEHFEKLRESMLVLREDPKKDAILTAMVQSGSFSHERIRWDWLWATKVDGERSEAWVCREMPELKSSHLDTALRRITGLTD